MSNNGYVAFDLDVEKHSHYDFILSGKHCPNKTCRHWYMFKSKLLVYFVKLFWSINLNDFLFILSLYIWPDYKILIFLYYTLIKIFTPLILRFNVYSIVLFWLLLISQTNQKSIISTCALSWLLQLRYKH
jgi:hypothetical protein